MKKLINTLDIQPDEWFLINNQKLKYKRGESLFTSSTASFIIYTAKNYEAIEIFRTSFYVSLNTFEIQPAHLFLIQELQKVLQKEYRLAQKHK